MLHAVVITQGVPTAEADWRVAVLKAMITTVDGMFRRVKTDFKRWKESLRRACMMLRATSVVVLSSLGKDGSSLLSDLRGTTGLMPRIERINRVKPLIMVDSKFLNDF